MIDKVMGLITKEELETATYTGKQIHASVTLAKANKVSKDGF